MAIQIIPENRRKTTTESLLQGLGSAVEQAPQIYSDYMQKKNAQEQLQRQMQEENAYLKKLGLDTQGLSNPELRKLAFTDLLKSQEEQKKFNYDKELQKIKFDFDKELQQAQFQQQEKLADIKNAPKNQQKNQIKVTAQNAFNKLAELTRKGNVGMGSGVIGTVFGGQTAKDTGEFQSLTGALEAILVDMVSRGTLTNSRFEYITKTLLPRPTDRVMEIEGKLKGLAEILELDSSALLGTSKQDAQGRPSLDQFYR